MPRRRWLYGRSTRASWPDVDEAEFTVVNAPRGLAAMDDAMRTVRPTSRTPGVRTVLRRSAAASAT
jgi:hypothetical protein